MKRLPRSITILGYRLAIEQVTPGQLRDAVEPEADIDPGLEGAWTVDNRTIYVLKSLSHTAKRRVLLHELQHALVDLKEWG